MNTKKTTPKHTIIKLLKPKIKSWKQPEESHMWQRNNCVCVCVCKSADFSMEIMEPRKQWNDIIKMSKDKILSTQNSTSSEIIFQQLKWNKAILTHKNRKFIASRPPPQEMLKEVIQSDEMCHQVVTQIYSDECT